MNCAFSVIIVFLGIHILNVLAYSPNTCVRCQHDHTCKPPNCICCTDDMPLKYKEIPQMVFFTFDDAITPQVAGFYRQLFDSSRRNPNGCPVSMTLFISHSNTVYSLVREFYQKGMEIASHSVSHGHPKASTFKGEAKKQKQNLARMARIPHTRIKGWRSPFLEPLGDAQPNMLQDLGYSYDATLTISKKSLDEKPPLPFTLDYGWPYDCKIKPCPQRRHRGFWEVPVISLMDYLKRFDCVYVDGCNNPPPDEEAAFQFLWDNFQSYYKKNKAPFGVNMHASWFFYPDRLKAMDRFIRELVLLDDVYIVNVKQVIDWLRNPVGLDHIKSFKPWLCDRSNTTSGASNSAFDLRNKQIEQRLKEMRHQRYVKQEMEYLQKHRAWDMQQAAKKAAAKYAKQQNFGQSENAYSRNKQSSAMTWQQMLMAHARKTHAKSGYQSKGSTNQGSSRRMVQPVNRHSDPKRKEIMLKEQRRIREQQRLAAEKRLKEKERVDNKKQTVAINKPTRTETIKPTKAKQTKPIIKQINKDTIVQRKHSMIDDSHNDHVDNSRKIVVQKKLLKPQHSSAQNEIYRKNKHFKPQTKTMVKSDPKVRMNYQTVERNIKTEPRVRYNIRKTVKGQRKGSNEKKIHLQESIDKPVQRKRIGLDTPNMSSSVVMLYNKHTKTSALTKNKYNNLRKRVEKVNSSRRKYTKTPSVSKISRSRSFSRPSKKSSNKPKKILMIGDSWNLFNISKVNTKIPWRNWIVEDFKIPMKVSKTRVQETKQIKNKPVKKTAMLNRHISASTVKPSSYKDNSIISSTTNTTSVVKPVKKDVKLTRTENDMSTSMLSECKQDVNCFLPDCFCMTNKTPFNLQRMDTPQIVYITIEADVSFLTYSKMRSLFKAQRKNPNGCSIGSTMFVSEKGTSYSLARNLQRKGTEIAMKALKSEKSNIDGRMEIFLNKLGDTKTDVIGWRSSDLNVIGEHSLSLFENRTIYDSSVVLERSMKSWPFTLNFGLNKFCYEEQYCQIQSHPGLWEVPIVPLFGFNQSQLCVHADECFNRPMSTQDTYQYLMKNFEKYYHNNRAPFGLHLTEKWFHWSYSKNLAGLSRFLDRILEMDDVYLVSIKDMLKWIKAPTKVSELKNSPIWNC